MAEHLKYSSPYAHYGYLIYHVVSEGRKLSSRAGDMVELEDMMISYSSPRHMPPQRSRTADLIGLIEGVQLIAGVSEDALMMRLFPKMLEFTDFESSYGKRSGAHGQIANVLSQLETNPDTRRAVLSIWDSELDSTGEGADRPCTLSIGFRRRPSPLGVDGVTGSDEVLNMTVTMRSNDVVRGVYGDSIQFMLLLNTFAAALGVNVGTYVHHAQSLHVYQSDMDDDTVLKSIQKMANHMPTELKSRTIKPLAFPGWNHEQIKEECLTILDFENERVRPKTEFGNHIRNEMKWRLAQVTKNIPAS
ncbi:MAG: thymidylate synthase [Alphaproteobacteria bacterium]|nr:thymidylate synthase [Alphaproteobacteria bacterium]